MVMANSDTEIFKDIIQRYAPWVLAIIFLIIVLLYSFAYFTRHIQAYKIKGSVFFDDDTLDFINRGGQYLIFLIILILILMTAFSSEEWTWENLWKPFSHYIPYIMSIAIILFFSTLIIKVIHRIIMNMRNEIRDIEDKMMKFRILGIIDIVLKWTINLIVWTIVIAIGLAMVGLHEQVRESVMRFIEEKLASVIFIIAWIFIIYFINKTLESFLQDIKKRSTTLSPQFIDLSGNILKYGLWLFTVILIIYTVLSILNLTGIGTFMILFFAIILILAVAVVLTTPLRNIFSGIVIINMKPFEQGDRIRLEDGTMCDIIEIRLWFTRLKTPFGELIEVPNDQLLKGKIINYSKEGKTTITISLNVDSKIPFKTVERSLREAAGNTWGVEDQPRPRVFARELQGKTIRYELVIHTTKIKRLITVRSRLIKSIQAKFQEESIPLLSFSKSED
ncbi:MAG: mechanosensitive ion channel [Thermoplasmata archaeon]|nr:MAG: mechanosensitive ion channel [Thermoplasmata archaeon]